MRAILSTEPGGPESLTLAEIAVPEPGPGEVAVAMEAAALNFFDTLIIRDRYQYRPERPFSPAGEFAGRIIAVGDGVEGFSVGDRVAAYVKWGAAREVVVAPASACVRVPDGVPAAIAATLFITYGTTLHALKDRARLRPGETLCVLGASGGAGLSAIELGKLLGARVIACASSAEKCAFARAAGADETIDTTDGDLKQRLKDLTGGAGVDVVYDAVGGDLTEPAVRATGWGGRYLVVGFAGGDIPKLPLNLVLLKGIDVLGVFWGRWLELDPEAHRANTAEILGHVAAGRLQPHIHATYPLAGIAAALNEIAARKVMGKVVLVP
ncbi:NADPH:quinone oxidoreductase family protein [Methylobrevis albus]|uniref:NADPH:quinone oxidoreductase family protein n=1 Tax=Methylobrevis albus TaxID=2793297 RepID=A0A931I107_9HYPH|nr:NADPH:quinone oxidoreductase family protein [Methylobrevis albus]MBH0237303.1 NADPH:quinone oxidoreductase family protein [Methylobrevis albus]